VVDPWTGQEITTLAGGKVSTVDIAWPDLDDVDTTAVVEAIVKADSTTRVPPQVIVRLLLEALGVKDVDGIVAELVDDQGRWIGPDPSPGAAAMQAVLDRGGVPAPALPAGQPPEPGPVDQPASGADPVEPAPVAHPTDRRE
jgi:hypothetical protein